MSVSRGNGRRCNTTITKIRKYNIEEAAAYITYCVSRLEKYYNKGSVRMKKKELKD